MGGAGRAVGRARKRRRSQQVEGYEEEVGCRRNQQEDGEKEGEQE